MASKINKPLPLDDKFLLDIFLKPILKSGKYRPAFGLGKSTGIGFPEFEEIYSNDLFYNLIGLSSPEVYASHKAAGGLTSVYRQIGVGVENSFRTIVMSSLNITRDCASWSYNYQKANGKTGIHTLDALVKADNGNIRLKEINDWLEKSKVFLKLSSEVILNGAVFEVRQGYKSADSKRQNADLRFGMRSYQVNLLPVVCVFSSQVSQPVIKRYRADGMLVLTGVSSNDPCLSTFAFVKDVLDYDLVQFFERNSDEIQKAVRSVVSTLLDPKI